MVFPFTFSVPILYNPFTTLTTTYQRRLVTTFSDDQQKKNACRASDRQNQMSRGIAHAKSGGLNPQWEHSSSARVLPPPAPASAPQLPPLPRSRKRSRGWEPAYSESVTVAPSLHVYSEGYIDTPRMDEDLEDMPAHKRRRTIAGSILSTAINAAFIGSAVGLTVYRLWRGDGKDAHDAPPPPYEEATRAEAPQAAPSHAPSPPPTPRRRTAQHHQTKRRTATKPRGYHHHLLRNTPPMNPPSSSQQPAPHFDFRFGQDPNNPLVSSSSNQGFSASSSRHFQEEEDDDDDDEPDSHLEHLSSKLSFLIESGKRALGAEVVVMSDAKEDEVDDGSGAWYDDDGAGSSASCRRKGRQRAGSSASMRGGSSASMRSPKRKQRADDHHQSQHRGGDQVHVNVFVSTSPPPHLHSPPLDHAQYASYSQKSPSYAQQSPSFSQPSPYLQPSPSSAHFGASPSPVESTFSAASYGETGGGDLEEEMEKARRRVRERMAAARRS